MQYEKPFWWLFPANQEERVSLPIILGDAFCSAPAGGFMFPFATDYNSILFLISFMFFVAKIILSENDRRLLANITIGS